MGKNKKIKQQRSNRKTFLLGGCVDNPEKSTSSDYSMNLNNSWNSTCGISTPPSLSKIQMIQEVESKKLREEQEKEKITREAQEIAAKEKAYAEFKIRQQTQAREINELMRDIMCDPESSSSDSEFFGRLSMRSSIQLGHTTSGIMSNKHPELTNTILGPFLSANSHNPMAIWNYSKLAKYREEAHATYLSLGGVL